jgi:cytochrome c peroxidase
MKKIILPVIALCIVIGFSSCLKDNVDSQIKHYTDAEYQKITEVLDLPQEPLDYSLTIPGNLGGSSFANQVNNDMATLGRVLFYDTNLSANHTTSCGSCHEADKAFADGRASSEGFDGEQTPRNSMALGAVVNFQSSYGGGTTGVIGQNAGFFWDDRVFSVAEQSEETIQNPIEMGMDFAELTSRIENLDYYDVLFDKAFPSNQNFGLSKKGQILHALQTFVNSIATFDSKFDRGLGGSHTATPEFANFTSQENLGKTLFNNNCASCHGSKISTTVRTIANNGLDEVSTDKGVGAITNNQNQMGVFKVPMLRNVELTQPYMHDGRFETLEDVIEHYSSNIQAHPNLALELRDSLTGEPKQMNFDATEKAALVAFLKTLTDVESLTQEKYLDPFK